MKRDYLSKLYRAARWYLPQAEAAEVLEDYKDLIEAEPRSEEELRREIGTPKDAVGRLMQGRAYPKWLAVFVVLAVCAALPAVAPALEQLFCWGIGEPVSKVGWVLLLAGFLLSFLWFQRTGKKEGPLPKGVFLMALVPLAGMVWTWSVALLALYRLEPMAQFFVDHPDVGPLVRYVLLFGGLVMGLIGLLGLFWARLGDRRWRAVYVWGLTGTILSLSVWALLSSMSLSPASEDSWQTPYLMRYIWITLVGLIGTGGALC